MAHKKTSAGEPPAGACLQCRKRRFSDGGHRNRERRTFSVLPKRPLPTVKTSRLHGRGRLWRGLLAPNSSRGFFVMIYSHFRCFSLRTGCFPERSGSKNSVRSAGICAGRCGQTVGTEERPVRHIAQMRRMRRLKSGGNAGKGCGLSSGGRCAMMGGKTGGRADRGDHPMQLGQP